MYFGDMIVIKLYILSSNFAQVNFAFHSFRIDNIIEVNTGVDVIEYLLSELTALTP